MKLDKLMPGTPSDKAKEFPPRQGQGSASYGNDGKTEIKGSKFSGRRDK